jgi:hypothetical protein
MQKRNFNQAKKQREATRKARQQRKLDRKHARGVEPTAESAAEPTPVAGPKLDQ